MLRMTGPLKIESHTTGAKIGLKFRGDVYMWGFARGILNHQKQFGHYFNDMSGLKNKVAFSFDTLRGQTSRYNVGLASQLPGRT